MRFWRKKPELTGEAFWDAPGINGWNRRDPDYIDRVNALADKDWALAEKRFKFAAVVMGLAVIIQIATAVIRVMHA